MVENIFFGFVADMELVDRIILLIWGSFIPSIFYGFAEDMEWVKVYWSMVSLGFSRLNSCMSESGPNASVQNHWRLHGERFIEVVLPEVSVCQSEIQDELTISVNTDHDHRSSDHGSRVVPTFPHASLETVPRFHVRCYGLERLVSCSPWRQDIRRCSAGATDGTVVAGHARRALYCGSWDLCCECNPL